MHSHSLQLSRLVEILFVLVFVELDVVCHDCVHLLAHFLGQFLLDHSAVDEDHEQEEHDQNYDDNDDNGHHVGALPDDSLDQDINSFFLQYLQAAPCWVLHGGAHCLDDVIPLHHASVEDVVDGGCRVRIHAGGIFHIFLVLELRVDVALGFGVFHAVLHHRVADAQLFVDFVLSAALPFSGLDADLLELVHVLEPRIKGGEVEDAELPQLLHGYVSSLDDAVNAVRVDCAVPTIAQAVLLLVVRLHTGGALEELVVGLERDSGFQDAAHFCEVLQKTQGLLAREVDEDLQIHGLGFHRVKIDDQLDGFEAGLGFARQHVGVLQELSALRGNKDGRDIDGISEAVVSHGDLEALLIGVGVVHDDHELRAGLFRVPRLLHEMAIASIQKYEGGALGLVHGRNGCAARGVLRDVQVPEHSFPVGNMPVVGNRVQEAFALVHLICFCELVWDLVDEQSRGTLFDLAQKGQNKDECNLQHSWDDEFFFFFRVYIK